MEKPVAAVTADAIMCAHRGVGGDNRIYWSIGSQDENNTLSWSERRYIEGWESRSGISLCNAGNGVLFCAFVNGDGQLLSLRYFQDPTQGWAWTRDVEIIGYNMADTTPRLVLYRGQLWCIHRGDDDGLLRYTVRNNLNTPKTEWSPDKNVSNTDAGAGPAALVLGTGTSGERLYTLFKGRNSSDTIFGALQKWPGDGWLPEFTVWEAGNTGSTPGALFFDGSPWLVHSGKDGDNKIWTAKLREDGSGDGRNLVADGRDFCNQTVQTQDGPTLVAVRNRSGGGSRLYMFYRGVGEGGWLYYSRFDRRDPFDTSAWIDENRVGGSDKSHQAFYEVGVCAFERVI